MQSGHTYIAVDGESIVRALAQYRETFVCNKTWVHSDRKMYTTNENKRRDWLYEVQIPDRDIDRINSLCNDIFNAVDRLRQEFVENTDPISIGTIFVDKNWIRRLESETEQECFLSSIYFSIIQENDFSIKEVIVDQPCTLGRDDPYLLNESYSDPTHAFDRFLKIYRIANSALLSIMADLYNRYVPEDKRTPQK